ncbi:putative bifunctional diguanylate cyclase/phosphodiesterase [Ideonella sp.]|uniref:putative bifunctional diguanylate cyclase/phosphodiesterase n=1 Tax=Ideonella sp. TaxID=1929293 RepID=UPI003BB7E60B
MPDDPTFAERASRYALLNRISLPIWIFDIDLSRVHWANDAALRMWNAESQQELCTRDMAADMSETVARRLAQYQSDFVAHGASFNDQWTLYPGGQPLPMTMRLSGLRLDDGRMAMLCESHSAEAATPDSLRSVEALLHTGVMISLYGNAGEVLYRNPAARASATRLDEPLATRLAEPDAHQRLLAQVAAQGVATLTLPVRTAQGERWHEISARRCRDAVTGLSALLVSEADVSAIKRTEAHANFLALHDPLTGLPNRSHVMHRFVAAMENLRATQQQAALIFIDLDHFKDVNDTLGHAAGDELLVQMAERLRSVTRSADLVARLGGDEFLILMVAKEVQPEIEHVRARLICAVSEPVQLQGTEVRVTPSIGVSLYPRDGTDIETLLRNADLAMYSAKERGRNGLAFYDEGMAEAARSRLALESELRRGLERGEFELYYQPRVAVRTGRVVGAEALVRWHHPERGLIEPDAFIPMCESSGLIVPLGDFVFEQVARQQAAWSRDGQCLILSFNLSARQFSDPQLLARMARVLQDTGARAEQLQVEITESMLLGRDPRTLDALFGLVSLGLSIALDDFGTGYSNLAYLHRFPIASLKIDKAFIQAIDANRPLAELIVSMCRLMKLSVVAEGVETADQLGWVAAQGIEQYQGFLCARPLPCVDFERLLLVQNAR